MSRHNNCGCGHDEQEALNDFAHAHRPKAMRRELPGAREMRNAARRHHAVANGVTDAEARAMVPPNMKGR